MTKVLGFTGSIGSGKTAASQSLHEIVRDGPVGHVEFSDPIINIADSWMSAVGIVESVGPREVDILRTITAEKYHVPISNEQARLFAVADLGGYLALRNGLPTHEQGVSLPNKEKHRPLLQWLGHQMMLHVDGRVWSRMVETTIRAERDAGCELVTVGGVRHADDARTIHAVAGHVVEVIRPGADNELQVHASEACVPPELVDIRLHNGSDLAALNEKMERLWADLQSGQPDHIY